MRQEIYSAKNIANLLHERKIATFAEIAEALGTDGRRTVFRKLKELDYLTSYSHRGSYYTLEEIARFDELGLWSYRDVSFSVHGSLILTAKMIVEVADEASAIRSFDSHSVSVRRLHTPIQTRPDAAARAGRVPRSRHLSPHRFPDW